MKEVVLGIGNVLKGDDGVGIYITEQVNKHLKEVKKKSKQSTLTGTERGIIAINCGTTPENYTSIIRRHNPDKLILVDAADMGLSPGSYRIISLDKIEVMHISTHDTPLSIFISYVSEFCNDIVLIGIQPDKMDIGTVLSRTVQESGDLVANLITQERLDEIKSLET